MSIKKQILLLSLLLLCIGGISQDYNYIHYTNKEGIAGNTVYGAAQDKDGFMFFATENGLSRFDGKEWKTFTVKDGLPDNEILRVFADSRGRVWLFSFNKSICYYFKGKIYNKNNDSLVRKLFLTSLVSNVFENEDSTIFFVSPTKILSIKNDTSNIVAFVAENETLFMMPNAYGVGYLFSRNDSTYLIEKNNFKHPKYLYSNPTNKLDNRSVAVFFYSNFTKKIIHINNPFNTCEHFGNYVKYINTINGVLYVDSALKAVTKHFLIGKNVYHTYEDKENNLWFTTLSDGVFKLSSMSIQSYAIASDENKLNKNVLTISQFNSSIIAGVAFGKVIKPKGNFLEILDFQSHIKYSTNGQEINRATSSVKINAQTTIIGFDSYLLKLQNNQPSFNYNVMPIKAVEKINDNNIIVATGSHCYKVRVNDLAIVDTLYHQRTTYAFYQNNHYYIGTLSGLYKIDTNKHQTYLGNIHPALTRRITCIKASTNGTLYIATADAGIVALKDDKVVGIFNEENGLSSNSCKTLHINNNALWVGTINGITKVDLVKKKPIIKYSSSDGLPSNIINAIYIDDADSTVWVGSPEGLTSFKEKEITATSICNLVMQGILVSNRNLAIDSNNFKLKYTDNNIQFNYAAISFRSGDDIVYNYKLVGLDASFKTTTERLLNYPTLPSGSYTLVLYATNKFGVKSKTLRYSFTIATPFWKTDWFKILVMFSIIVIIYFLLKRRFDKAKKLQAEKAAVKQQLAAMEQLALQAQMNPHFIFNCLNSIQQFIMVDDKYMANKYLTQFASLIRNTLDNSAQKNISIAQETAYLKQYLDLEKLRFGDNFNYEITVANNIDKDFIELPAMLLQPYVENSLRHGIRLKNEVVGLVTIDFKIENNILICTVKDNGVGRAAAAKAKSTEHIEYQSKGMSLTEKRIELLNTEVTQQTTVTIIDLVDNNNNACGTEVIVKIPV